MLAWKRKLEINEKKSTGKKTQHNIDKDEKAKKNHLKLHNSDGVIESFVVVVEEWIFGFETLQPSHTQDPRVRVGEGKCLSADLRVQPRMRRCK